MRHVLLIYHECFMPVRQTMAFRGIWIPVLDLPRLCRGTVPLFLAARRRPPRRSKIIPLSMLIQTAAHMRRLPCAPNYIRASLAYCAWRRTCARSSSAARLSRRKPFSIFAADFAIPLHRRVDLRGRPDPPLAAIRQQAVDAIGRAARGGPPPDWSVLPGNLHFE